MIILNLDEYNIHKKTILYELKKSVFVYPTDTIYGIGCNATDEKLVAKVRKIKNSQQPFSIIVPNKEWIYQNCVITQDVEEWIRKLPGPYTLILELKNPKSLAKNVYHSNEINTIGIRLPNHWFSNVINQLKFPIITTSANISGRDFMTNLEDLDTGIRNNVDYVFYEGPRKGFPSTIVHLQGPKISVQQRKEKSSSAKIGFPLEEIKIIKE